MEEPSKISMMDSAYNFWVLQNKKSLNMKLKKNSVGLNTFWGGRVSLSGVFNIPQNKFPLCIL